VAGAGLLVYSEDAADNAAADNGMAPPTVAAFQTIVAFHAAGDVRCRSLTGDALMSADRIRFLMVGGFLGAGKTTMIAQIARHYVDRGLRVGVVTNDQAYDLVDTHTLRAAGLAVGEVPGACFCCKFDDLVATASQLSVDAMPDVILAEPVGSCTDLAATVIEPLSQMHGDRYEIGPLAVLLKPEHGKKILRNEEGTGFSPKAAYIFLKQIEEADIVVVNKIDTLSADERAELIDLVERRFPSKEVLATSARSGEGIEELIEAIGQEPKPRGTMMEVDYDVYAEGEAELGWLNAMGTLTSTDASHVRLDDLLLRLVEGLRTRLAEIGAEPAHMKVLGQTGEHFAIANVVSSGSGAELSRASDGAAAEIDLIVNARVAVDPDVLWQQLQEHVAGLAAEHSMVCNWKRTQHFRPGRPVPTHRVTAGQG
jgi:G3E family GTPase